MGNDFEREAVPVIQEALKEILPYDKPAGGAYYIDIYCDRNDKLPLNTIAEIIENPAPEDAFNDIFYEMDMRYTLDNEIGIRDLFPHLSLEEIGILCNYGEETQDWLWDHVFFYYPREHFLRQKVRVNLILATFEEADRDFGSCSCLNDWGNGTLDKDCALVRIAEILGCKEELFRAVEDPEYKPDDPFVASALDELIEFTDSMGAVTVLAEMSLQDLIELQTCRRRGSGSARISKNATMGIFDPWQGGGSHLEINPTKDLTVPVSLIWDVWPEGTKAHGCDINDVYGLCLSAWQPDVVSPEPEPEAATA